MGSPNYDALRQQSWARALHAAATSWIFERRTMRIKRRLDVLTYVGLGGPLVIGSAVLAYGVALRVLPALVVIVAVIEIAQLLVALWSVIAQWTDRYRYAITSTADNTRLCQRFEDLARTPPTGFEELRTQYELIDADYKNRETQDLAAEVSDEEKRAGMRYGLRKYQRRCAGCNQIPHSMEPSSCGICGDFNLDRGVRRWL